MSTTGVRLKSTVLSDFIMPIAVILLIVILSTDKSFNFLRLPTNDKSVKRRLAKIRVLSSESSPIASMPRTPARYPKLKHIILSQVSRLRCRKGDKSISADPETVKSRTSNLGSWHIGERSAIICMPVSTSLRVVILLLCESFHKPGNCLGLITNSFRAIIPASGDKSTMLVLTIPSDFRELSPRTGAKS